ncbi:MAG TPA: hypothetical protein VJZ27_14045, partial [Aggregatilineales bacterium]|nr:hypothetical protein [Aggregatilineales bacterium]
LMEKRGLGELEAKKRVSVQNPQSDKLDKAHVIIKNNGTPEETWSQVQSAWHKIGKGEEDTEAIEAVQTIQVAPETQPQSRISTQQTTAATTSQTMPAAPIKSIDIKRPRPSDFDNIAKLINQETGSSVTRNDIMATFGEKTYMLAEANGSAIGIIAFLVENLVTRVDEFTISKSAPLEAVGKALIEAMERASDELQSEIAFVFLAPEAESHKAVFQKSGYEEMRIEEIRYPAWREAINEYKPENKVLLSRRLRENLVLKPI